MKNNSIKNLFIAGLTLLSFGFLSAQFIIPSGINNALQVIERVLVTTTWTFTGSVVMDTNTGANHIYINPSFLPIVVPYSWSYILTLSSSWYLSLSNMTDFIQNNSFVTNGSWSFGGATSFTNQVTFSTGPVNFNNVNTTFSGGTVNNNNVSTNNNGGTTTNTNNTVNNNGTTINNTGVTTNNYSGTISNYYTGSSVVYHSGTTIIFSSGVVLTGAGIVWLQGPQWATGATLMVWDSMSMWQATSILFQWAGISVSNIGTAWTVTVPGGWSSQFLSFNSGNNTLEISGWNSVDLPFWSLMGNAIDDTVHFLGTVGQETLRFFTNNVERMTILWNNWYIWINNQNPEKMLHVNGAIASSLMKVSTWGTSIDLYSFNGHYENLNNIWPTFLSYDWSPHYTPDNKAFFFPLPQGTNYFGDGGFLSGLVQYIVFIDVQDVNTVILEPGEGEAFYVWGFINGTAWQKLSVIQRDFAFDGSGNVQNVSLWLPSPFFEAPGSGEIIQDISMYGPNTLDFLFSSITQSQRGSAISDSYKHFPSHPGIFNGWFEATYNGSWDAGGEFAFQVLDVLGVCNLPREFDEDVDDGMGTVCVKWTTYVYDGEYWLRTYGGI